ncbi:MAG: hypothetical protein CVU09_09525 [Bacteroidetes bacterium HGW-Bacteroidetes-4]|nr:MAG: hypothetical protein CVU09_09525 [Bacteroidetes bacterium HGW-Bacteroidetes-4]
MWETTVQNLLNAGSSGYGQSFINIDNDLPDVEMIKKLKENIYRFAGFKTHNHLVALNKLLIGDNGQMVPYNEFRKKAQEYRQKALKVNDLYNEAHLYTEYQTALIQSQHAAEWQRFEADKDIFPYLKFNKTPNEYDRHKKYDGLVFAIDDPILDALSPQLDWGCECYLTQEEKKPKRQQVPEVNDVPAEFASNVGKTGEAFNEKHNYFKVEKGAKTTIEKNLNTFITDFEKRKK